MKQIISTAIIILSVYICGAQTTATQASPSNLNAPANAQPVPSSTRTERSAVPPAPPVVLPTTVIPPIYPGAETHLTETQPNLIHPASPPATTQPAQTEPLVPVESTNVLNPTQPPRDRASRKNKIRHITHP